MLLASKGEETQIPGVVEVRRRHSQPPGVSSQVLSGKQECQQNSKHLVYHSKLHRYNLHQMSVSLLQSFQHKQSRHDLKCC